MNLNCDEYVFTKYSKVLGKTSIVLDSYEKWLAIIDMLESLNNAGYKCTNLIALFDRSGNKYILEVKNPSSVKSKSMYDELVNAFDIRWAYVFDILFYPAIDTPGLREYDYRDLYSSNDTEYIDTSTWMLYDVLFGYGKDKEDKLAALLKYSLSVPDATIDYPDGSVTYKVYRISELCAKFTPSCTDSLIDDIYYINMYLATFKECFIQYHLNKGELVTYLYVK